MGLIKQIAGDSIRKDAWRAYQEGHSVFVAQFRGAVSHSPELTRPIGGMAERIEAVEAAGWRMDQFTAVPWNKNITVVALFRRRETLEPFRQQGEWQ